MNGHVTQDLRQRWTCNRFMELLDLKSTNWRHGHRGENEEETGKEREKPTICVLLLRRLKSECGNDFKVHKKLLLCQPQYLITHTHTHTQLKLSKNNELCSILTCPTLLSPALRYSCEEIGQINPEVHRENKRTMKNQNNLGKRRIKLKDSHTYWYQNFLKSYSHQDSMVLV